MFKNRFENEFGLKINFFRFDVGGELTSKELNNFYEVNGIKRNLSTPKTSE